MTCVKGKPRGYQRAFELVTGVRRGANLRGRLGIMSYSVLSRLWQNVFDFSLQAKRGLLGCCLCSASVYEH